MMKPCGPLRTDPERRWLIDGQSPPALTKTKQSSLPLFRTCCWTSPEAPEESPGPTKVIFSWENWAVPQSLMEISFLVNIPDMFLGTFNEISGDLWS